MTIMHAINVRLLGKPFKQNGESVNGHILIEWGFSQWPHSTGMGIQLMATFYWNGDPVNGHILLEWGVSEWPQ